MKRIGYSLLFAASVIAGASALALAQTPSWTPPADSARCPSKWGANDERGSGNHMKPLSVLNAIKFIKTGEVIELGHVLNASMPFFGGRSFKLTTRRIYSGSYIFGSNHLGANQEVVDTEIGQVGTQFDGLAHITHENSFYNCFKFDDIATPSGFTKLGVQNAGTLITRGVLIDVAAYKGVEMLPDTYEITVADLEGALQKQNLTVQPGDAIIINTGWGKLWGSDNARYNKSNPGIGVNAAEWLIAKDPMLIGSDNVPVEVIPNPDSLLVNPVHQLAINVNGVHLLENLRLDELAAKRAYEFAFIVQPLKLEGATGSTVAPVAVR
jgi:kynurenine formamidase